MSLATPSVAMAVPLTTPGASAATIPAATTEAAVTVMAVGAMLPRSLGATVAVLVTGRLPSNPAVTATDTPTAEAVTTLEPTGVATEPGGLSHREGMVGGILPHGRSL